MKSPGLFFLQKSFHSLVILITLFSTCMIGQRTLPVHAAEDLIADYILDTTFDPGTGANSWIWDITLQPDAKMLIGGIFNLFNGTARRGIARLNPDGSLDGSFTPGSGAVGYIGDMLVLADGRIIIGGGFISYNGQPRAGLARLNSDGSLDETFVPGIGPANSINALALQPDEKIIFAGCFTGSNCAAAPNIARINSDGAPDPGFDPGLGADYSIQALALQPDGKILIAGSFKAFNGTARQGVARLNPDGSLDTGFDPSVLSSGSLQALVLQPDGKVLIAGTFTLNSQPGNRSVARLNPDGSLDSSFTPGTASDSVSSLALRSDGRMFVGGSFGKYNDIARSRLALLNSDGSLNADFNPGAGTSGSEPTINVLVMQPDNKLLLGGSFTAYNGVSRNRIARLTMRTQLPGPFGKISPVNGTEDILLETTLEWQAINDQVIRYEVCYDTIDNAACDGVWQDNGLSTSLHLDPLKLDRWTTYYWQVRAINGLGETYADGGAWWTFSTAFRMVTSCTNPAWSCENVDQKPVYNQLGVNGNTVLGLRISMDLDSQGFPHIVYLQLDQWQGGNAYHLRYAFWDGSRWKIQVLDTVAGWHAIPSIQLDSQDTMHIVYFKNTQLKYITWNGYTWLSHVMDQAGKYLSMDLDRQDRPHLSYCNGTDLKYAVWDGGGWNIETIDTSVVCQADTGPETTLALDQNDRPHVLFLRQEHILTYGAWKQDHWDFQEITSNDYATGRMALDQQGNPHIAYAENTVGCVSLEYKTLKDNNWTHATLASCTDRGYDVGGIAVDSSGNPHISFSRSYAGYSELQYAGWNGTSWDTVPVQLGPYAGSVFHAPLTVDAGGKVSICFNDRENLGATPFTLLRCASNVSFIPTTGWRLKAPMTTGRSRPAAASVHGKVYVIGGRSFNGVGTIEQTVEEYDPISNSWTNKALKPTNVSDTGAAVIDNKIYVPGGYNFVQQYVSVLEVYDPATNQWSSAAPLPVALSMPAVAAVDHKLYVMGGSTTGAVLNTCYGYDSLSNTWFTCAPMPHARLGAGAGVVNHKIYVVGGEDNWSTTAYVDEYDPSTNQWVTRAPIKTARSFAGVAGFGDFLYVCGGDYDLPTPQNSCEKFDPIKNTWSAFDPLNRQRSELSMVEAGGRLYATGGWDKGHSTVNEESAPLSNICFTLVVSSNPTDSGTVPPNLPPNCPGGYRAGTVVQLTAKPKTGYAFQSWSGEASGTINPIYVVMTGNKLITATFKVQQTLPTFADVPVTHKYYQDIEILYANGLTGGCSTNPLKFCPDQSMNRGQAAVFILRANFGPSYAPPTPTHYFKDDWTKGPWAEPWAEGMKLAGLSAGCQASPPKYCPWDLIPREQAVIFALRMKYGTLYTPPHATGTLFADMTNPGYYATPWAEQAYKDGIIPNCGTSSGKPKFCPKNLVSRGLAAYMIVRAKNLTMP